MPYRPDRILLERVHIDRQGYDRRGRYWGVGAPLFSYETPDGEYGELRAVDRAAAKKKLRERYPGVKIGR